jgi:hypothetical protein
MLAVLGAGCSSASPGQRPTATEPDGGTQQGPSSSTAASRPASLKAASDALPAVPGLGVALPLGSVPIGTAVTSQFANLGIVFSGQRPFITNDGSSPTNPTLSGTPLFHGAIVGTFVKPGTASPRTVDRFSLYVGYIDSYGSVQMTVYDSSHRQIGVLVALGTGFVHLVSNFKGAASFAIAEIHPEPSGFEINTIQVQGSPTQTIYAALGDSYSSGEGTDHFDFSQLNGDDCHRSSQSWPVQAASIGNSRVPGLNLSISASYLIACTGEKSGDLGRIRAKEAASELDQAKALSNQNGPPGLVTLTIGGNDVDFAGILKSCYIWGRITCSDRLDGLYSKLTKDRSSIVSMLKNAYSHVAQASSSTNLVVVGYPAILAKPGGWSDNIKANYHCIWMDGDAGSILPRASKAASALNDDIASAAAQAGVRFVNIQSALSGHELCTGDSWMVKLSPFVGDNAGHPNSTGQRAVASAVINGLGLNAAGGLLRSTPPSTEATVRPTSNRRSAARAAAAAALKVSAQPLGDGMVGEPYDGYAIAEGGVGAFQWAVTAGSLPPGLDLNGDSGMVQGLPTAAGAYSFTLTATDAATPTPSSASQAFTIAVATPQPLRMDATDLTAGTIGQSYTGQVTASGGVGRKTFSVSSGLLPAGLTLDPESGVVSGVPQQVGTASFAITASDQSTPAAGVTATVSVSVLASSSPLQVLTTRLPAGQQGHEYQVQLKSTGGVGPLTWEVATGALPDGLSLDPSSGVLSGGFSSSGTATFTVAVTDQSSPTPQHATSDLQLEIAAAPPLTIDPGSSPTGVQGSSYSWSLGATGGTAPYSWAVADGNLPSGLFLDPSTGVISGTPNASGTFKATVSVSDAGQPQSATSATVEVTIDSSPLIADPALPPATVGQFYIATVTPTGGSQPYTWSQLTGDLPPGLTFDTETGTIYGVPTTPGTSNFSAAVTDSADPPASVSADFSLEVDETSQLHVDGSSLPGGTEGSEYSGALIYSGGTGPYQWSVADGSLPDGLSLDPDYGMVTGTPTAPGAYTFTVHLTDSSTPTAQVADTTVTLNIGAVEPLVIDNIKLPDGVQGNAYLGNLSASGGSGTLAWSVPDPTSWPQGLTLNSDGSITGTPVQSGQFDLAVAVTDQGQPSPQNATGHIALLIFAAAQLTATTDSLPAGVQGQYYEATLTSTGGVAPTSWRLTGAQLPEGLTLDPSGQISGTPATGFDKILSFEVVDSSAPTPQRGTVALRLAVVGNTPPPPPSGPVLDITVTGGRTYHSSGSIDPATIKIVRDRFGVATINGRTSLPGSGPGNGSATVEVHLNRLLWFNFYIGTISITDSTTTSKTNLSGYMFAPLSQHATTLSGSASGISVKPLTIFSMRWSLG